MIIDPVDNEIGEPGGLSGGLEELIEKLKRLLAEVIAEDLEAHQGGAVVEQRLCEECQAEVLDVVVGRVQVDQGLVLGDCLSQGLGSVVGDLVVGYVQGLEGTVRALQILGDGLTTFEGDLVAVQVEYFESIIFE